MKKIVLVTGSGGLIGSASVERYLQNGWSVIGIDNDLRKYFFNASVQKRIDHLSRLKNYCHYDYDIRDSGRLKSLFSEYKISAIIHTAAQPSHDWAAKEPITDFSINATGTLNLLELARKYCPEAPFVFTSTNKVYGDTPNKIPLKELQLRYTPIDDDFLINESMSIDNSTHSLFGVSKTAADLLVQEYGKYFNMPTVCFRAGCITGPNHQGAELHGFLSYLVKCVIYERPYTVFGYKGKQVRDNIHCDDLIDAFDCFIDNPVQPGEVYNIGGGKYSNISMLEAIAKLESLTGKIFEYNIVERNRTGDHVWYISDLYKFEQHYPNWSITKDIDSILISLVRECKKLL